MWGNKKIMGLVVVGLLGAGCGVDHGHGGDLVDEGATQHPVRDLATQPCTLETWQHLAPDLRECALANSVLGAVSLRRVNLSDSTLENASLEGADLFKAVLVNVNLRGTDLRGTNLTSADLSAADLTHADLRGARFPGASFPGASLAGVLTDASTVCASGAPGPCW